MEQRTVEIQDKISELKELDKKSRKTALVMAFSIGIGGALILGIGLSSCILWGSYMMKEGVLITIVGAIIVALAFPAYHFVAKKTSAKIETLIKQLEAALGK